MDSCDVLVVGGGPAGSTLARTLSERGLEVVILDKNTFPRDKVCAGWITVPTLDLLRLDREEYSRGRILQAFTGFRTSMIGRDEVLTRYGGTVSYGIRRSEFDHYLLGRSSARLWLGEPLRSMERQNGAWIVNGKVRTQLVAGAGGHFCPVSRILRRGGGRHEPVVIAQEAEFEMDGSQQQECPVRGDTPELYFCDDLKGYGWCVRKGNVLNIGLGREGGRNFSEQMQTFIGYLKQRGRITAPIPATFKGHAYLLYHGVQGRIVDDGVVLIGDAAGLACPKSGEGIRPAVESALMAAEVILSAGGDYRGSKLLSYRRALVRRFGRNGTGQGILPQPLKQFVGRKLMENGWFARHVLLDRWFLNLHTGSGLSM